MTESHVSEVIIKALDEPDEVVTFPNGRVESVTMAGVTFHRAKMAPEWHWLEDEKDIVEADRCPKSHHIYIISGTLGLEFADGETVEVTKGEAVAVPPHHDSWTVGAEELVYLDIQGAPDMD